MEKKSSYEGGWLGRIGLVEEEGALIRVVFGVPSGWGQAETPLLREAVRQLGEYLAGCRREFSLPLAPHGSGFELAVWRELLRIPYGETRSYGQLAAQLGRPGAARAVGSANRRNPLPLLIPCHRVVGMAGGLTGYLGGVELKRRLLELERGES